MGKVLKSIMYPRAQGSRICSMLQFLAWKESLKAELEDSTEVKEEIAEKSVGKQWLIAEPFSLHYTWMPES